MAKTGKQVQGDVYRLLKDSTLYAMISGDVYRNGMRPRDSRLEDAVVTFTAGFPDQVQTGVVTVNIFVPDVDPYENGVLVEDGERTEQLECLAQEWADSLTAEVSCYMFRLMQTIYTEEEADIHQHFIVIKLAYRYFGGDNAPVYIPQEAFIATFDDKTEYDDMPVFQTEDGLGISILPSIEKNNI